MDKMALAITAVCRNGGFSAFLETFVLVESSGNFSNFGAENPPLPQAAKRYLQYQKQSMEIKERTLLILDIDETLIHATQNELERKADFKVFDYYIYKRPYLEEFLKSIQNDFFVAVWSSASDDYVKEIARKIFPEDYPLEFVWGRSRCTAKANYQIDEYGTYSNDGFGNYEYTKPLKKVRKKGYRIERILIIDDTPFKSKQNYGNAIYPKEFKGEVDDKELYKLSEYLKLLKNKINVREIEKRGWNK